MHLIESFIIGAAAGATVVAIYYRRAAAEAAKLKQEVEARAKSLL